MTDHENEPGGREGRPPGHRGLPSARERAPLPDGPGRDGSRRGRGKRGRARDGSSKPTAAREIASSVPALEMVPAERVLSLDDERWIVRVLGRAGGTSGVRAAPLLLLGFSRDGAPRREAFVVGRELASLTDEALERALGLAREEPGDGRTGQHG